ncbi:glutathione synthase [Candidatus Rickettsiella isopodorum]|uniref:Glutathione synthetase n=1 Tax=Candidatus Rickettsiella isopodorum TaxID=1225476 RepID=A0A1J8NIF4_9COXI|nr:glutathione synthase [Candidatus Rickettsiella isopodorum]OIZ95129.1 glutathione synthase [Candidatus Rickettsiella isopodorum]
MLKPLGVIMDPITGINPKKDTTLALLLAAQQRDWPIFYMEARDLFLVNDKPYARMRNLQVKDDERSWFTYDKETIAPLASLSVILMRQDPPVDRQYIYTTQLLDKAEQLGVLIVNHPQSLRDFNEKLFTLNFPQCCPPSLVTSSIHAAQKFLLEHQDIIAKPLDGMGGYSVFRLRVNDPNNNVILETLTANNQSYMMVQRYIPEVRSGDKRIIMIHGEPIPYALARVAPPGETRANLAVGGIGKAVKLTERDVWVCQQVGPRLREKGLLFVGLDIIGDYLTEINITSPTGVREIDAQCDLNISAQFIDTIFPKASL